MGGLRTPTPLFPSLLSLPEAKLIAIGLPRAYEPSIKQFSTPVHHECEHFSKELLCFNFPLRKTKNIFKKIVFLNPLFIVVIFTV